MRVLNALAPETAALIRAHIAGKPMPKAIAKAPKRKDPIKCYVSQYSSYDPRRDCYTIQLPIAFRTAEYNAGHTPAALRAKWVAEKRTCVWLALDAYLKGFDRSRVRNIEFVRIGLKRLDDDNVVSAFKAVRDATCAYLVWGGDAPSHIKAIGSADDKLWKDGVRWTYRQMQCESNPRLYGLRLVLHCVPRDEQP